MPIYEYRCPKCGDFDHMQKITERPLKKCPTCKGKVSKLVSNPAFHLKGGGWYVTDYARKGTSGGSGEAKSGDAGDSSSSGESKPSSEGKAEKKPTKKKGEPSASAAA